MLNILKRLKRIDILWNSYLQNSLNEQLKRMQEKKQIGDTTFQKTGTIFFGWQKTEENLNNSRVI